MSSALVNVFSEEQFSFNGKKVRSFYVNGESLLIAKDVCLAVGYNQDTYRNALEKHVPSKYKLRFSDIKGGVDLTLPSNSQPEQILLKEPGLYCLLLRSKKDEAEPFMDWVVEIILPREVRKLAQAFEERDSQHQQAMEEKDREHRVAIQRKDSHIALIAYNHDIANGIIRARDIEIENLMRNRHVPLSGKGYDEVFIIVKKNCDSEELYPLYLICRQKRSANQALLKLRKRYPHLEILTQFDTPNSIHRWNEIKQRNPAVIQWSDRHFRILNPDIELEMFALTDGVVG